MSGVNSSAFSVLNDRLLSAGKVQSSGLSSIGKPGNIVRSKGILIFNTQIVDWICFNFFDHLTGNAIINAQMNSSLYDGGKLAADPLIAHKQVLAKTTGKGWFNMEVQYYHFLAMFYSIMYNLSCLSLWCMYLTPAYQGWQQAQARHQDDSDA